MKTLALSLTILCTALMMTSCIENPKTHNRETDPSENIEDMRAEVIREDTGSSFDLELSDLELSQDMIAQDAEILSDQSIVIITDLGLPQSDLSFDMELPDFAIESDLDLVLDLDLPDDQMPSDEPCGDLGCQCELDVDCHLGLICLEGLCSSQPAITTCLNEPEGDLARLSVFQRGFRGAHLVGALGSNIDLSGLNFGAADLSDADLSGALLIGADLNGAILVNADLSGADLSGASLDRTDLSGADLSEVELFGASARHLMGCPSALPPSVLCVPQHELLTGPFTLIGPMINLYGLNLRSGQLTGVNLDGQDLEGLDLTDADLTGASFVGAKSTHLDSCLNARLPEHHACTHTPPLRLTTDVKVWAVVGPYTKLSGIDFETADMTGVDLTGAELERVRAVALQGCPETLPEDYRCTGQAIFGPTLRVDGQSFTSSSVNLEDANLTEMDLQGTIMRTINLSRADLSGSNATNMVFDYSNLSDANLTNVDLSNASLIGTNLNGANMSGVTLSGSKIYRLPHCPESLPNDTVCVPYITPGQFMLLGPGVDLTDQNLGGYHLDDLSLSGVNFTRVALRTTDGIITSFQNTDLRGSILDRTNLQDVDLSSAHLSGAHAAHLYRCPALLPPNIQCRAIDTTGLPFALIGPNMSLNGVSLENFDFEGMDLSGVDLRGADLSGSDMTGVNLDRAKTIGVSGCPSALPEGYQCVRYTPILRNFSAIIGPNIDMRGADLRRINMEGVDLTGALISDLEEAKTPGCPSAMPTGTACITNNPNYSTILAAGVNLADLNPINENLDGLDLSRSKFENVIFTGSMIGVSFNESTLINVNFVGSNLEQSTFTGATVSELTFGNLQGCPSAPPSDYRCFEGELIKSGRAKYHGLNLAGANLSAFDFSQVEFENTNLSNTDLNHAQMSDSAFLNSNLSNSDLSYANLSHANLEKVNLSDSDLTQINLSHAVMSEVNLSGVELDTANLTRLRTSYLTGCPASLPEGYVCRGGSILGPNIDFAGTFIEDDLAGVDLSNAHPFSVTATDLNACPSVLPRGAGCLELTEGVFSLFARGCKLARTLLSDIQLCGAELSNVYMSLSSMPEADLQSSELRSVSFPSSTHGEMSHSNFTRSDLRGSDFRGTVLTSSDLSDTDLRFTDLRHANLSLALLERANLAHANLSYTDFSNANLRGAYLVDTDLRNANFSGADIEGAILIDVNAGGANFTGVRGNPALILHLGTSSSTVCRNGEQYYTGCTLLNE